MCKYAYTWAYREVDTSVGMDPERVRRLYGPTQGGQVYSLLDRHIHMYAQMHGCLQPSYACV